MRINTNVAALNSYNQLNKTNSNLSKSLERLSSGKRINRAADDAAGLAISEKMNAQTRGLAMAQRNAQDGISMLQTAEGALKETHSILQRMRELSVQASNDTTTQQDRREIQKEMNQLIGEVDRIGDNTEFNTKTLLDGTFSGTLQIGANESQDMAISIASMKTDNIGTESIFQSSNGVTSVADLDFTSDNAKVTIGETTVNLTADYSDDMEGLASKLNGAFSQTEGVSVKADGSNLVYEGATDFGTPAYAAGTAGDGSAKLGTAAAASGTTGGALISSLEVTNADTATTGGVIDGAESAITALDNAINTVSAERSKLGAYQNRLDHTINNLNTSEENLTAAESRISDVDMAKEMMNMSKNQILSQAGTAMMAQANQLPQGVLQLLG